MNSRGTAAGGHSPAIAVVIPLYNKQAEIERTLHSVLNQTFRNFEVIVVDDGSTDGGGDIAAKVDDPRICVIRQANAGVSAARNRGIAEAQTDLVAFLDADDEWKPTYLATIWALHQDFPEAGIYGTAYERHLPDGRRLPVSLPGATLGEWRGIVPNYFTVALVEDFPLWSSAIAVPKAVFSQVGGFPVGVKLGEDLDMWLRILLKYPVAYANSVQAVYHQDASNRAMHQKMCNERLVVAETAARAISNNEVPPSQIPHLQEYVYMLQLLTASECAKAGNLQRAREMLQACRGTTHFRRRWLWWRLWASVPQPAFNLAWKAKRALRA